MRRIRRLGLVSRAFTAVAVVAVFNTGLAVIPLVGGGSVSPAGAALLPPTTGAPNLTRIAAGRFHSLAVATDGTVSSWGYNAQGQLGDTTTTLRVSPTKVKRYLDDGVTAVTLDRVVAVAAGDYFSLALDADGQVWSWGDNSAYQLGNGTTSPNTRAAASRVVTNSGFLTGVTAIAAGAQHGLAVGAGGLAWAWGESASGRLGALGSSFRYRAQPVLGAGGAGNLTGVVSIEGGANHTLAVKSDGTAWAWGANDFGQLGTGSVGAASWTPVRVQLSSGVPLVDAVAVSAGSSFSLATMGDGTVKSWGKNDVGQLAIGSTVTPKPYPQTVQSVNGTTPFIVLRAASVSAGTTTASALDTTGREYYWGGGDTKARDADVRSGQVAVGDHHKLIVRSETGTLWAKGSNGQGELGTGSTATEYFPVRTLMDDVVSGVSGSERLGDTNPSEEDVTCRSSAGVDCATGNFSTTVGQLSVEGRGVPLNFAATYNSRFDFRAGTSHGQLASRWTHSYAMHVVVNDDQSATVVQRTGRR